MRAAVNLFEVCEKAESGIEKNDDEYNKIFLRTNRNYRYDLLRHQFRLKPTEEEKDLWDEIMEELD